MQWLIDRWVGGPSVLPWTPQNRLEFTLQMQHSHMRFRLPLNVMWEICSQNILDPIYTCISVHLWLDASALCKRESTGVQRPFAVSKSHSRKRVWGGEKEARNGIDWAILFPDLYSPFLSSLSSIHLLSLHGRSTHPQPAIVLQRSRAFFDIEMKNIPFSNEWMSACRLLVFL